MQAPKQERSFVHLAYIDDSDTKQKSRKWQVMCGVILSDTKFAMTEILVGAIATTLIPAERMEQFEEFHACELYGGYGVFEGIDQQKRFHAINMLLSLLRSDVPVIYGGVDIDAMREKLYASADPLDISFRICIKGIQDWVNHSILDRSGLLQDDQSAREILDAPPERIAAKVLASGFLKELVLLVVDDCDKKTKDSLYRTYRSLRSPRLNRGKVNGQLYHFHDDMYFGDSRYSIGIQLADICSYFIARHLEGDKQTDGFYQQIEPHIIYHSLYPQHEDEMAELRAKNAGGLRSESNRRN